MTTQPTRVQAPVCTLGEGPVWDARDQSLYWVDIPESRVHQIAADGSLSSWDTGQPVGTVVPRASGGLAVAVRDGFMALDPVSGALTTLADVERDKPGNRMNDGTCDRAGRFYAGTMALDETPGGGRRPFAAVGEDGVVPDGLTVDADGGVWVAVWGGYAVLHHDPAGKVIEAVDLPAARVSSCVFGGPDLDRLYITTAAGPGESAGALFVCEPGVTGQPSHPFRG